MCCNKYRPQVILSLFTVLATLSLWLIFYLQLPAKMGFPKATLETIFANYDGPNYIAISKCSYDKNCLGPNFSLPQPLEYYPAHLPGYPMMIRLFSNFTTGPKAMLFVTLLGSVLMTLATYALFKDFWVTFFLIFLPPRIFILRSIGAPETWFIFLTLASIYFFKKNKYFISAIFAALSIYFKTPGIILGIAYLYICIKDIKNIKKYLSYLLMPLTLLTIFVYYKIQTGNFFAYFNSGDNFHLNPLPFLVFISTKSWIGSIWLEEILYIYFFAILTCQKLYKKFKLDILSIYPILFTALTLFVAHRDISRYIAPVYPFVLFAFKKYLNKPHIRLILFVLIPAIYLYSINFIIGNTAPIADWTPYL